MSGFTRLLAAVAVMAGLAAASQDELMARLEAAMELDRQGEYALEEAALLALLKDTEKLGPDNPWKAQVLNNLGTVYCSLGRHVEAEAHYLRSIKLWKKIAAPESPNFVSCVNNLASLYIDNRLFPQAERLGLQELAARMLAASPTSPETARLLDKLAMLDFHRGRYKAAEHGFLTALSIWEGLGSERIEIVLTLNNLGFLYRRLGRQEEALSSYRRGFAIADGQSNNDLYTSLLLQVNIAVFQYEMRAYSAAETSYKKALALAERILGLQHPVPGQILIGYADVVQKLNRKAEAKELRLRGEAILRESEFGDLRRYAVDIGELSRRR